MFVIDNIFHIKIFFVRETRSLAGAGGSHFMGPHCKGRLQPCLQKLDWQTVTNTLAFFGTELIYATKMFWALEHYSHLYKYTKIHTSIYTHTQVCVCVIYLCVCSCIRVVIFLNTHTHTQTHTHIWCFILYLYWCSR